MGRVTYEPRNSSAPTGDSPLKSDRSPSFEELAMPLLDSAYNFAYWLVRNRDDADDLVQETYLKAFRSFASFRSDSNFRSWMFRILKNTFLTWYVNAQRAVMVPLDSEDALPELQANSDTAESRLVDRARVDVIRAAIERLPIAFREVMVLCDVEDASYREIAEILSIPIGTVMSRLARARRAVRESLSAPELALKTQAAVLQ